MSLTKEELDSILVRSEKYVEAFESNVETDGMSLSQIALCKALLQVNQQLLNTESFFEGFKKGADSRAAHLEAKIIAMSQPAKFTLKEDSNARGL